MNTDRPSPTKASDPIKVGGADTRERKKRQREIYLAAFGFLIIAILTWVELRYLGVDSYLFLALFNLDLILIILVLFLVLRNVVKLVLERRRKVLGARLRSRLVLIFLLLSILPTTLMFFIAIQFVQTSVDYWFKNQVDNTMEQALLVGRAFLQSERNNLSIQAQSLDRALQQHPEKRKKILSEQAAFFHLSLAGTIDATGRLHAEIIDPDWEQAWPGLKSSFFHNDQQQDKFWSMIWPLETKDLAAGIHPRQDAPGYVIIGRDLEGRIMNRLELIERGIKEYRQLKNLKAPLKTTLYLILGVMTLLILLGATWFGFRLAKEISAPVQALAAGTQRIARGDLSVRLEDKSTDELGVLVQSFNRMAEDLESSQASLTRANVRLAGQNTELESRENYIRAVLNNITAGVVSVNEQGLVSTVNRAAESLLGIDAENIVGRSPLEFVPQPGIGMIREILENLTSNPSLQWQRQIELSIGGKTLKLLVNAVVLKSNDGRENGIVAVFEDISELEKMQRLNAWKEVARRIAHEIKNPLTPIKLSAQRLEKKFGPKIQDPAFHECTELIVRQADHLRTMVTEFSSFARIPEIMPRMNDRAALALEVVQVFQNSHRTISWNLAGTEQPCIIPFDQEALRRALMNLLLNAAEILDGQDGGRVDMALHANQEQNQVSILIQDNGPGLTPEERTHMFEPYYSRKRGGTGLGLTIVKSIVNDHRGNILVRSRQPCGTCFEIILPASQPMSA